MGIYKNDLLAGKRALIVGVATERSIAWGLAKALIEAGVTPVFTYQDRFEAHVRELVTTNVPGYADELLELDVMQEDHITRVFEYLQSSGGLDILVHSIAFAPKEALTGRLVDNTSLEAFRTAMEVSAYSLIPLVKAAEPLMVQKGGGSVLAMTYLGGDVVIPGYNVMATAKAALQHLVRQLAYDVGPNNIRVNGISAGPMNTLAARGIAGFRVMYHTMYDLAPLPKETTLEDLGNAGVFLCSEASASTTGQILYVDAGGHIIPPFSDKQVTSSKAPPA